MTMKKSEEFSQGIRREPPSSRRLWQEEVQISPLSVCADPQDGCKRCECQPADFRLSKTHLWPLSILDLWSYSLSVEKS